MGVFMAEARNAGEWRRQMRVHRPVDRCSVGPEVGIEEFRKNVIGI
jgi:hypothetical protein